MILCCIVVICHVSVRANSIFDCAEKLILPVSAMGSMPYEWVAAEGGRGGVTIRFKVGPSGRAKDVVVDSKVFNMGRWVRRSVEGSTFKRSCVGLAFTVQYIVIVHLKTSVDLPLTIIGPGNEIRLEFLEVDDGPLRERK